MLKLIGFSKSRSGSPKAVLGYATFLLPNSLVLKCLPSPHHEGIRQFDSGDWLLHAVIRFVYEPPGSATRVVRVETPSRKIDGDGGSQWMQVCEVSPDASIRMLELVAAVLVDSLDPEGEPS